MNRAHELKVAVRSMRMQTPSDTSQAGRICAGIDAMQAELTALRAERDAALGKLGEAERERDEALPILLASHKAMSAHYGADLGDALRERDTAIALVERYGKALDQCAKLTGQPIYNALENMREICRIARDALGPVAGQRGEGTG